MSTEEIVKEIRVLRQRFDELIKQLEVDVNLTHTFDVVLRVRTRERSWPGGEQLHSDVINDHFNDMLGELCEAVSFTDPGDEIKVLNVTEVDNEYP